MHKVYWCKDCGVTFDDESTACINCNIMLVKSETMTDMVFYGSTNDIQITSNKDGSIGFRCFNKNGTVREPEVEEVESKIDTLKSVLVNIKNFNKDYLPDQENKFNSWFAGVPMPEECATELADYDFAFEGGTPEHIAEFIEIMQNPRLRLEAMDIEHMGEGARLAMESPTANAKAKRPGMWEELRCTSITLLQKRFTGSSLKDIQEKWDHYSQLVRDKVMPVVKKVSERVKKRLPASTSRSLQHLRPRMPFGLRCPNSPRREIIGQPIQT